MSLFTNPNYNRDRYGTGEPGTPEDWKAAYEEVMGQAEAEQILNCGDFFGKSLEILGIVDRNSLNLDILKKAYRSLVFKVHPDYGGTDDEFNEVCAAYSYIKNELES